jgi:P-type Ca2+ transporter type 2C
MSAPTGPRVSAQPTIPAQRNVSAEELPPYLRPAEQVVADVGADVRSGLTHREAARRLQESGPNKLTSESRRRSGSSRCRSCATR